jgi:hypothetical protein
VRALERTAVALLAMAAAGCGGRPRSRVELSPSDFVTAARAGTARYASQEAAIADGFRRVGTDFPAMGEHWVNLPQVMADSFAPARPSVLTYIKVGGVPRLVGVAYIKLLGPHEQPPDFAPAQGHWHEHNGSIVEESFLAGHEAHTSEGDLRVAILHAWIWIENPDGLFVTDNWSLPFVRLGATMPDARGRDAARSAALATAAADYYSQAIDAALAPSPAERSRLEATLADYRRRATADLRTATARGHLTAVEAERLADLWPEMWRSLETALPARAETLREVRRRVSGMTD